MKKDNRDDWELHRDGDCEFDCPFCYDEGFEHTQIEAEETND